MITGRQWMIFLEWGSQAVPYILEIPKEENVNEDEISLCIAKQYYGKFRL